MKIRSAEEARANWREVMQAAIDGEVVIIERRGVPAAKLAPLSQRDLGTYRDMKAEGLRDTAR